MIHDLRYALRMLRKQPAFAAAAILTLALGIGANTAIFTLIDLVLFRPLPVEAADRLVVIATTDQRNPGNLPVSHLNYKDYRDQSDALDGLAALAFAQVNVGAGGDAEQAPAQIVTGNFFSVLGVRMARGRGFLPEEDAARGAHPVAVISHGYWERSLGRDPDVVGATLTINRHPFTIVGVAPRGFTGLFPGAGPALWVPTMMHEVVQPGFTWYEERRGLFLVTVGRLKPGVTLAQAQANTATIASRLEQAYPDDNRGRGARILPLLDFRINPDGQGQLARLSGLLMGVVGVVLLIACANIANLLLARAARRRREVAVRLALGAARSRLVRQLLTESVVLALAGGAAGLLVAYWALQGVAALDTPLPFPIAPDQTVIEGRVLAFTAAVSVLTGLLFGLVPALQASRQDLVPALKNEIVPAAAGGRGRVSLRQALVVAQVAMSLLALVAAGLFVRSLRQAEGVDPGFETDRVLLMTFNLGREGYTPERGGQFYEAVTERVAALPGVRSATLAQNAPFAGGFLRSVFFEDQDTAEQDRILIQRNAVGLRYFETLGIPLLSGRDFTDRDRAGAPPVVIINQTMADRFWPGGHAVGRRFRFFGEETPTEIVGVVRDSKYNGLVENPQPFIYEALLQDYAPAASLHVRTAGDASALAGAVRDEVARLDPTLTVFNVQTLRAQVDQSLAPQRTNAVLLSIFGLLALTLASIGIYGVASYAVSQRTREIGIRLALGADRRAVLRLVLGQGLVLVAAGLAIGIVLSLAAARLMSNLLFGVGAADPAAFAASGLLLLLVAAAASYLPARRATRIDPVLALRNAE